MLKQLIPEWLRTRIAGRDTVQRVAGNTAWLAADQVLRLAVGFVVTVWVARYLGPDGFGKLNFATAFCAPFAALVSLSLNGIAVRDLVREPGSEGEILGTMLGLKSLGSIAALATGLVAVWNSSGVEPGVRVLVSIVLAGTVLQAGDVLDVWLQGRGEARAGAIARSIAFGAFAVVKLGLVFGGAQLVWFAVATSAEVALCTLIWGIMYARRRGAGGWTFSAARARVLVAAAWPLAIAGVAIQVQGYFDQVLLGSMKGTEELGAYSAAFRLVAVFGFIPMAVQTAAAPEITRAHAVDSALYARRLRDVYRIMIAGSIVIAIPLLLLPGFAVEVVFGSAFTAAAALLPLLTVRLLLTGIGVARSLFITNEGLFAHAAVTAVAGMVLNIVLNLVLIPSLGSFGCIVASVISFTVTVILLDVFHPKGRTNLRILASALGLARLSK